MSSRRYVRASVAQAALELMPPSVRATLLQNPMFKESYGLVADGRVSLGDQAASFQRSELFAAIRSALSGEPKSKIADAGGHEWEVRIQSESDESVIVEVLRAANRFVLPDFAALSPDRGIRVRSLEGAAADVNLPAQDLQGWLDVLSSRPLEDDELDGYHKDFRETPAYVAREIGREIEKGGIDLLALVPSSRRYFERLVGAYDGSASVAEYARGEGRRLLAERSLWRSYDGFLDCLYLSSHSTLTAEISIEPLESQDLLRAFGFVADHSDRLSQIGAIEIGLRVLPQAPDLEPFLVRLIKQIRDEDADGAPGAFRLLSSLFVLVDGAVSAARLMPDEPPFYRRLASLAHAALVHRQLVVSGVDTTQFSELAKQARGEQYYFQSWADMRSEPRWEPDFATPAQMRSEFIGRMLIAAQNCDSTELSDELRRLLLDESGESVRSASIFPYPYLPGPLEGAITSETPLPRVVTRELDAKLGEGGTEVASFFGLVNSVLIFNVGSDYADRAAEALSLGRHRLSHIEDRSQLLAVLSGLATVAAVTRSHVLANELRVLTRTYRNDRQYRLSVDDALRISLTAAASYNELDDWSGFVGDWLTELAFGELERAEAEAFLSHLQRLCHAVPELWTTCGRAEAALKARVRCRPS